MHVKIVRRIARLRLRDIVFQSTFKRAPGEVVSPKSFVWNGVTLAI